jgi:HAD superfamily hydrolase (TIGR01509 family)
MLKSNPSFYSQVLEQINSQPEQSVLIDDHQGNLDIALSLGMKVILFTGVDDLKSKLLHLGVVVEK